MPSCRLSLVLRRPELFHEDLENEFRASIFAFMAANVRPRGSGQRINRSLPTFGQLKSINQTGIHHCVFIPAAKKVANLKIRAPIFIKAQTSAGFQTSEC